MKKHIILSALFAALCGPAFAQTAYLSEIGIDNRRVEKTEGRKVSVSLTLDCSGLDLKRQQSLMLVPVIVSADGSQEQSLHPVVLNGKVRHKVNERQEALYGTSFYPEGAEVLRRLNGEPMTVDYREEVPFRRWMIGGELLVRGYVVGCAACEEGNETAATGDILPPMSPSYITPFITPKEETVKRRSETRSARLQFRRNSAVVERNFNGNRAELDSVKNSILLVKDNSDLTITGIYVTGYASPEGRFEYNMKLSERRAKAFTEYIKDDLRGIDPKLYHVDWKGEDWAGVRAEVVKHPGLLKIDEVLDIIDHCGDDKDACEERLKALQPSDIYQRLLNEMYPVVRRNEYRVEYNVRHFDLEEGKRMIQTRPDLMSVSEIQKVADSYGKGTPQYVESLLAGVKAYPQDITAVNNAALALLDADRTQEAIDLLKRSPEDGALLNLLGVAYLKAGKSGEAEKAFTRSASLGNADGQKNLATLEAYTEYMAE